MTREEAIKELELIKAHVEWEYPLEGQIALNMAIKALEQEPSCRNTRQVDLISRQDAIDALDDIRYTDRQDWWAVLSTVENLPSVQPKRGKWILDEEESKKHIEPIYICSACKNYEAWGNTEKTPFCPNCGARMESDNE